MACSAVSSTSPTNTLSYKREKFVRMFTEKFDAKYKEYFEIAEGKTSKTGKRTKLATDFVVVIAKAANYVIPVPGVDSAGNVLKKATELAHGYLHKGKAETTIGKIDGKLWEEELRKIIVHTGANIFFLLERQLMEIKYTAEWNVAYSIIAEDLVDRAIASLCAEKDKPGSEKWCDKTFTKFVLYGKSKPKLKFFKLNKDLWTPEGIPDKVGLFTENLSEERKYFVKKTIKLDTWSKYGFRRTFPWEDIPEACLQENEFEKPTYKYIMTTDELKECKDNLLEILKETKDEPSNIRLLAELKTFLKENLQKDPQLLGKIPQLQNYNSLPEGLKEFLIFCKNDSCKICVISSLDCDITAERLKDAGGMTVVNWQTSPGLQWSGRTGILVISHVDNVEQMVNIVIKANDDKPRRIIIITNRKEVNVDKSVKVISEKLAWQDLSDNFKNELIKRNVIVQGRNMLLENWVKLSSISLEEIEIHGQLLIDLIKNNTPEVLKNTLKAKLPYYIKRKIRSRRRLDEEKIFRDKSKDVFVFSGLEHHVLDSYVKNRARTDTAENQIKKNPLTAKYILLGNYNGHFQSLCKNTNKPVHWIDYNQNDKTFQWIKSKNSMNGILNLVKEDDSQEDYEESKFLEKISSVDLVDLSEQPVCICDSPGMGKSSLLTKLGREILKKDSNAVVIFHELPKLVESIKNKFHQESFSSEELIQHLFSSVTTSHFGESCLKSIVNTTSVNLLLDAFDEVPSSDISLCKEIIMVLHENKKKLRVFVTSRTHFLSELEEIFLVLGWNILPFSKDDQIDFLYKHWKTFLPKQKTRKLKRKYYLSNLKKYTTQFVTTLNEQWNDKDREVAGIPLQCFFIGQVFESHALASSNPQNYRDKSKPINPPEIGSLTNLYTQLVTKQLNTFEDKYTDKDVEELDRDYVNRLHAAKAFNDLLPDFNSETLIGIGPTDLDSPEIADPLLKIGIIEKVNGSIQFVHRTFAEYFVAKGLFDIFSNLQSYKDDTEEFENYLGSFFETILTLKDSKNDFPSFQWSEILYHLNALLQYQGFVSECGAPFKLSFSDEDLKNLSHSLVHSDLNNIFKLFVDWKCFDVNEKTIFSSDLLCTSVSYASLELVELVTKYFNKQNISAAASAEILTGLQYPKRTYSWKLDKTEITLLHVAITRGNYEIFKFLLDQGFHQKVVDCQCNNENMFDDLLHVCVEYSMRESDSTIENKINIIKLLLKLNTNLLKCSLNGTLPIDCRAIHLNLFNLLLETLVQQPDLHGLIGVQTLTQVLHSYNLPIKTLELYKKVGFDFKNVTTFQHENQTSTSTLLHIAAHALNFEAVTWLIDEGLNVNGKDSDGNTPLLVCCLIEYQDQFTGEHKSDDRTRMIKLLMKNGADHKRFNKNGENMLHLIAWNKECVIRLIDENNLSVNSKDNKGNTPLHFAALENPCAEVVIELVKRNEKINAENNDGFTPFDKYLKESDFNRKTDVQCFNDLNGISNEKQATTSLKVLISTSICGTVHFLLERGFVEYMKTTDVANMLRQRGANVILLTNHIREVLLMSTTCPDFKFLKWLNDNGGFSTKANAHIGLLVMVTCVRHVDDDDKQLARSFAKTLGDLNEKKYSEGQTLLHLACQAGSLQGVEFLVTIGANVNAVNDQGETPLELISRLHQVSWFYGEHLYDRRFLHSQGGCRYPLFNANKSMKVCILSIEKLLKDELELKTALVENQ